MTAIPFSGDATSVRRPAFSKADIGFLLMIANLPILLTPPLQAQLLPIPLFKLTNIVAVWSFGLLLLRAPLLRSIDQLERNAVIAFMAYMGLFLLAFLRSIPNLGTFHAIFPDFYPASPIIYGVYEVAFPGMMACSFLYIVRRARAPKDMLAVCVAICGGIFVLSVTIVIAALLNPDYIITPERAGMATLMGDYVGMHYTTVGTMYTLTAPILIYMAHKRGAFWTLNFILALVAVIIVQARTSLLLFGFGSVCAMVAMGRTKFLLSILPMVALGLSAVAGTFLVSLISQGVSGKYGFNFYQFLSGRDTVVWLPLLLEWFSNASRFWFGAGLHGISASTSLQLGLIFPVAEAHNMFIEVFLDYGLLGLCTLLVALTLGLRWAIRTGRRIRSPFFWVLFTCFISYLISCLTGRHFFPNVENLLMFPILGMLVNTARLKLPAMPQKKPSGFQPRAVQARA